MYLQLYTFIKREIENGRFEAGCKMPSARKLCTHLGISRNTVGTAYAQLHAEGYLESKERSGFYVARDLDTHFFEANPYQQSIVEISNPPTNIPQTHSPTATNQYDFKYGQIDYRSFPFVLWKKAMTRWIDYKNHELLRYGHKQGEESLRLELAKYIRNARGVKCMTDQIFLTSGTQMSLDLICKLLRHDHKRIAIEDPGYIGGRTIFDANNFKINPIQLDPTGINLDVLKNSTAKLVLVAPSHQFPYGMIMPVSKRIELLKWADQNNGIIIENDYEGEFSYSGKPIPCLQNFDSSGRVIYLYTFSSSLLPSVRISFFVLPLKFLEKYHCMLKPLEQTVPIIEQKALEYFISEGHWEKHIRKMKNAYSKKFVHLVETIQNTMHDNVEVVGGKAGLHILLRVKSTMKESTLIERAAKFGVTVYPTSPYWLDKNAQEDALVLLGFGGMDEKEIHEGIALLNRAWFVNAK